MAEKISRLPGVKELLIGPAGSGKTHSISTLTAYPELEVFYLALEPGLETLRGAYTDRGQPIPPNLHWHSLAQRKASFTELLANATKINTLNLEALAKTSDVNRSKYDTFLRILTCLNDFVDQRTGKSYGCVDSWGPNRVLVIDGLTGINNAAMELVVGGKPVRNQSDWGIAQGQVIAFLRQLCDQCKCHVVILGHVEREVDAVLGGVKLMVATLGKALAPQLPSLFSDVILAERQGTTWTWNTGSPQADLKARNVPFKEKLDPSFKQVLDKWLSRGGAFSDTILLDESEVTPSP